MSTELKTLHDRLLAEKPEGVTHDEASCPLCAMEETTTPVIPEGGSMSEFTQEQVDAAIADAVAKATAPLQTRLAELEAAAQETEVGKAVSEATAPLNEQIAELQQKLDAEVMARTTAEEAKAEVETFWSEAIAAKVAADEADARKDDRLAKLKEVAPEGAHAYLDENADRFAAMSDEDFEARIEEYRTITAKAEPGSEIPQATALTAAREGAGVAGTKPGSMLSELPTLRRSLTDPRTL